MDCFTTDQEMFEKARALHSQHSNPKFPPALKNLCFDFFLKNNKKVTVPFVKKRINIFRRLPNGLKNDMLQYLVSKNHANCSFGENSFLILVHMLLSSRTVKLDMPNFEEYLWCDRYDDKVTKILRAIELKAPEIEYFGIDEYDEDMYGNGIRDPVLTSLVKLTNLTHLSLRAAWVWYNRPLSIICQQMDKLVYLKLLLDTSISANGLECLVLLKHLREFHFCVTSEEYDYKRTRDYTKIPGRYQKIYSWCAHNVPQLKMIGGSIEDALDDSPRELTKISPTFSSPKSPSQLECLHSKGKLPTAKLLNLKQLLFGEPGNLSFVKKISTYKSLTDLHLLKVDADAVEMVLEKIGRQLSHLFLIDVKQIDHYLVLHFCPNLVKYEQQGHYYSHGNDEVLHQSKFQALVNEHHVRLLQVFRQAEQRNSSEGILKLMLQAPLIQRLMLQKVELTKFDCEFFHEMWEGKTPKIKSLQICNTFLGDGCTLNDVDLMIKQIICSAPNLKSMSVTFNDPSIEQIRPYKWMQIDNTDVYKFHALLDKNDDDDDE